MLEVAAAAGEIELKYLDESGFCMWSPVSYTYFPQGFEQIYRKVGKRKAIMGGFLVELTSFLQKYRP